MSAALRIALVKPDWGIRGGGEIAVDHTVSLLEADGHRVERKEVFIPDLPRAAFGLTIPDHVWDGAPEYFRHLAVLDAVEQLDVSAADLVISTQPPSYAADHPRHLSIFFHHLRVFYDLSEQYLAAGFLSDEAAEVHLAAQDRVRELDQARLDRVDWFCPISETVQQRLATFNGVTDSSVLHFGVGVGNERPEGASAKPGKQSVLCVSRSEFPKRTELFIHALKFRPDQQGLLVGSGGRLAWAQAVDRKLSKKKADLHAVTAEDLWRNKGEAEPRPVDWKSNITFTGRVGDLELLTLYRGAPCVVCPAYDEDYGLTALEAMAHGRPVIVCRDGGGLTDFVQDGVNGLVVEPTGEAIAEGIGRIVDDKDFARTLGEGALETAATYTWERCAGELRGALDRVMG